MSDQNTEQNEQQRHISAAEQLVEKVGGIEQARELIEALEELKRAG